MSAMESPVVISVVIPSYNHVAYVEDAIRSVSEQVRDEFKLDLIVLDDGSTDGSVELLERLVETGCYDFKLIIKSNEGLCKTLNRGIREHSIGSYVAIIASDDMWRSDKLMKQLRCMQLCEGSELCYSGAMTFGQGLVARRRSRRLFVGSGDVRSRLTLTNFIPAGTMFFTRELFDKIGGFDETGILLEDWDFLLRASAVTEFSYVDEELLLYRLHDESSIVKMRRRGILFSERMKVLRKNRGLLNPVILVISMGVNFLIDSVLRRFISKY